MEFCFIALRANAKAWLDDFLLHAATEEELREVWERFLKIC